VKETLAIMQRAAVAAVIELDAAADSINAEFAVGALVTEMGLTTRLQTLVD
jgi:hypothetical protein